MSENTDTIDEMAKEMDELEAENQSLRTQLSSSQAEVGRLREALEEARIYIETEHDVNKYGRIENVYAYRLVIRALSSPSPAADRIKADLLDMCKMAFEEIVLIGKDGQDITGSDKAYYRKKVAERALEALEKAGG